MKQQVVFPDSPLLKTGRGGGGWGRGGGGRGRGGGGWAETTGSVGTGVFLTHTMKYYLCKPIQLVHCLRCPAHSLWPPVFTQFWSSIADNGTFIPFL